MLYLISFLALLLFCSLLTATTFFYLALRARQQQLKEKQEALKHAQIKNEQDAQQLLQLTIKNAALETQKNSLEEQINGHERFLKKSEELLFDKFQRVAHQLLEEKSTKFCLKNKEQLQDILLPLKDRIKQFETEIRSTQRESADRNIALRTQLNYISTLHQDMARKAQNLTEALKGRSDMQGFWGEFVLDKILENSGLRKGIEYLLQVSFTGSKGKVYRPDAVVYLPGNRQVILDAKVSLVAYEKFFHSKEEEERQNHLKNYIKAVKAHIKTLAAKNYAQEYAINGLDFILMFLPIEPAFSLLVQTDRNILAFAQRANIILVSPSTLTATLKMIANTWQVSHQNQHALQILSYSGKLYDKFALFVEEHKKIGHALQQAEKAYQESHKKLASGQGNLISKAEKLKELGAKTSKELLKNSSFVQA